MLSYLLFIATVGGIYGLLALSLNLIWGGAGMVNLGLAGFFAVGAYASALLTTAGHSPIAVGWLAALVAGGAAGLVVTLSTTRLREDYLAIVTLGFAEVVRLLAANEIWLTRGSDGISGIPGPWKAALGAAFNAVYFLIVLAALAVVFFVVRRIDRSPYGRALRAIREDAQVAQVAGKPVLRFKTEAFTLSAAVAGLAGALYGHFTSYIAPDLFLPLITVYIFLSVASGGTGRPAGALVGAYLVMTLLESSRFFVEWIPGVTAVQRAALKELLIAVALILVLRLKPSGVLPERIPPAPRPAQGASSMTTFESCLAALRQPGPLRDVVQGSRPGGQGNRRPQAVHASLRGAGRQTGETALHQHAQGISRRRLQARDRERLAQARDRRTPRVGRLQLRRRQMGVLRS